MKKLIFFIILIITLLLLFFLSNFSYRNAIVAQYYYETKNYQKAYDYAVIAYNKNRYNNKAFTIKTRSNEVLKCIKYIKEAEKYKDAISNLLKKKKLQKVDLIRVKIMSEYIMSRYNDLKMGVIKGNDIVKKVNDYYKFFKAIYGQIKKV